MRIERDLGPRVAVLVLTGDEMAEVEAANPLLAEPVEARGGSLWAAGRAPTATRRSARADPDPRSLHATFLFAAAGEDDFGQATEAAYSAVYETAFGALALPVVEGERAIFVGSPPLGTPVVYLHLPHGYGRTKLTNAYFERKLGTGATTRNWRTVLALAAMSAAASGVASGEGGDE